MRCVSQLFQPVITIPKNAKIKNTEITCKSQKLLLECGLVRPTSSGFFALLPLARRALDKLERIVIDCIESAGVQRVSLPALTASQLWETTGRLEDVGSELMKLEDRHGKKYLLAPTHEEAIADLLADVGPISHKQLPIMLYQLSSKYRDEARPKHGVLRAREFAMLDAYGAHAHAACARDQYQRLAAAYRRLFQRLQLPVYRVQAPSGDMGGSISHEWQLPAAVGEDQIDVCASCSHATLASDEGKRCASCGRETERVHSIEVGHTFILGTKYSDPLGAHYVPSSGPPQPLIMSCYGIGVTRLLAASLEALSSDKALRWPKAIAPYSALIIGPKEGSKEWLSHGWERVQHVHEVVCRAAGAAGVAGAVGAAGVGGDVIVDDRHALTIGKRLMMGDRMGYPIIIVCGKSTLDTPTRYEVYRSGDADATVQLLTLEQIADLLSANALDSETAVDNKVSC